MSQQHDSDKVKETKRNRRMGSNGPERRSTSMGPSRSTDAKFTAPTPGLENVFFGRGNEFKDVVRELASYVASQDSTGAMMTAVGMSNLEKTKPKRPTVRHSAEYLVELEAYFDKEDEWAAKVRAWK